MDKIKITLPDGSDLEFETGITVKEVAYDIGKSLGQDAVAGEIDGELLVDISHEINRDLELSIITIDSEKGLEIYRHTTSHIMAHAVKNLYDNVKLAIGPTIEDGFYYDFDMPQKLSPEDFEEIEKEMKNIIDHNYKIKREILTKEEGLELMKKRGEDYKVELIQEIEDEVVSFYRQEDFIDLCQGPHLPATGRIKAFKLLKIAGAYWRGDEKNKMLQRVYGTSFRKKSELNQHLEKIEEAKKRDHRQLGKKLDLFSLHDEGKGFPFFHPKGMVLRNKLIEFWREEHKKAGYKEIKTPVVLNQTLWKKSGHWDHYKDDMYFTEIDDEPHAIKPMNCPGAVKIYKNKMHSYRDLPIRWGELGLVHRHELSGTLHGLMRVRNFTQDDAHIFCLPSQIKEELRGVIDLMEIIYSCFDFNYNVELSTKPEKAMGSDQLWDKATEALKTAIDDNDLKYEINKGDGAFYGPKIDFNLEDCLGRTWQCGTIQLDFQMPERFDLTYTGEDDQEHRPVMIHRAIFGSLERFIGILIEHFAGAFPVWLSPIQVEIIPIADAHHQYADNIKQQLKVEDIRVEVDNRDEKVGYKIREAQVQQIPYMLIVGDDEIKDKTISVRERREGDIGSFSPDKFKERILKEINSREI